MSQFSPIYNRLRPKIKPRRFICVGGLSILAFAINLMPAGCGGNSSGVSASAGLPLGKATAQQVALGRYLVVSSGCGDCHARGGNDPSSADWLSGYHTGDNAGVFQLGPTTTVHAANITPDMTNGIGMHTDQAIYNVLKYGYDPMSPAGGPQQFVAPVMPWASFRHKTDAELWAIVAYVKHGVGANANVVAANTGIPPDNWAGASSAGAVGPALTPAYPAGSEAFNP